MTVSEAEREKEMARRGYSNAWLTVVSIMAKQHVQKATPAEAQRVQELIQQYNAKGNELEDYQRRYVLAMLLGRSFFAPYT